MGQRHNRRRTRFRPRSRNNSDIHIRHDELSTIPTSTASSSPCLVTCDDAWHGSLPSPSLAPSWLHHGFAVTWEQPRQLRLRPPRLESEMRQCRVFGGEPGDDVDLCYRMLEYFGGLDYIDSLPG